MLLKCRLISPTELASSGYETQESVLLTNSPARDNQLCTSHLIRKLERTKWSRKGSFTSPACQAVLLIFIMHPDHLSVTSQHCIFTHKVKVKSLSRVRLFATPWIVAYQASPSMGLSRQEYWSGLPFPSPGDLTDWPGDHCRQTLLPSEPPGKSHNAMSCCADWMTWHWPQTRIFVLTFTPSQHHTIYLSIFPRGWGLVCLAHSSVSRADTHKSA